MLTVESAVDRGSDGRQRAAASGGGYLQDEELRRRAAKAVEVLPRLARSPVCPPTLRYRNTESG
jgi:hypothetical protein